MKGLLLKDWYLFTKRCRMVILLVVAAGVLPVFFEGGEVVSLFLVLVIAMIPATLLAYDEQDGWSTFSAALPYTKRSIVAEKYLFGLGLSAVAIALAVVAGLVGAAVRFVPDAEYFAYLGEMAAICAAISFIMPAIVLPFMFRFGVEKGRMAYYVFLGVGGGILFSLMSFSANPVVIGQVGSLGVGAALLVAVPLWCASLVLSVRLFSRRRA